MSCVNDYRKSDTQTLTALGATPGDDFAPILGGHAGTKAVSPFTLENTGLKGSFHLDRPVRTCIYRVITAGFVIVGRNLWPGSGILFNLDAWFNARIGFREVSRFQSLLPSVFVFKEL